MEDIRDLFETSESEDEEADLSECQPQKLTEGNIPQEIQVSQLIQARFSA